MRNFLLLLVLVTLGMSSVVSAQTITFSNIQVTAVKDTSVVIQWDADVAANGQIEYGLNVIRDNKRDRIDSNKMSGLEVIN